MPPFVSDSFTDTSATALASHVGETGATWTEHGSYGTGDAVISNANRMRCTTTAATCYYASGVPASAEYDVEMPIYVASVTGRQGPSGRLATGANTMYNARYDQPNTRWDLLKLDAGVATVLGSASQTLSVASTYAVKLEIRTAAKKVYVDGAEVISSTDDVVTAAGRAGFRANTGSDTTALHAESITATDASTAVVPPIGSLALLGVGH